MVADDELAAPPEPEDDAPEEPLDDVAPCSLPAEHPATKKKQRVNRRRAAPGEAALVVQIAGEVLMTRLLSSPR
jgi:hypothetical protein